MQSVGTAADSAARAGLRYASGNEPGIRRRRQGRGFAYIDDGGRAVDARTLARIRALVLPPAWTDVWIARDPRAHLQATGRDARRRKQYRYHQRWSAVRDAAKYDRLRAFGRALPAIRRRVASDLRSRTLSRSWVLATVARVLERAVIRVGNHEYLKANGSYGLTTLQDRHAKVAGDRVRLQFKAKSGVKQVIEFNDAVLAKHVRRCQELPGQRLFQYMDNEQRRRSVSSGDVNGYLHDTAGAEFTAKDFRTWFGTLAAARALDELEPAAGLSKAAQKKMIVRAMDQVARTLGNTRTVCRKCYVHPVIVDGYLNGRTLSSARRVLRRAGLEPDECALLTMLDRPVTPRVDSRQSRAGRESRRSA